MSAVVAFRTSFGDLFVILRLAFRAVILRVASQDRQAIVRFDGDDYLLLFVDFVFCVWRFGLSF